jgi:Icc-related predicted phosphoesterase
MKIQYCSDLHLEFAQNADYLLNNPIEPTGDVLILAGDITSLLYYDKRKLEKQFFKTLSKQFERVFWICGNHEFYRSWDVSTLEKPLNIKINYNVFLLNNVALLYKNVRFVFSTLWSNIGELEGMYIGQNMSDFDLIRYKGVALTPSIYTNRLHNPALAFLRQELAQPTAAPTVVVTHHLPSLRCVHEQHRGSLLNPGFATNLDDFITESQPQYWIYGHSHANMPLVPIGQTQLITNQLGYVAYGEHQTYQPQKWIEV